MAQEGAKPVLADRAAPDVPMAVQARPQADLGVVHVQAGQPVETDRAVEVADDGVGVGHRPVRDAGRPQVLGVETDAQPAVVPPRAR